MFLRKSPLKSDELTYWNKAIGKCVPNYLFTFWIYQQDMQTMKALAFFLAKYDKTTKQSTFWRQTSHIQVSHCNYTENDQTRHFFPLFVAWSVVTAIQTPAGRKRGGILIWLQIGCVFVFDSLSDEGKTIRFSWGELQLSQANRERLLARWSTFLKQRHGRPRQHSKNELSTPI